VLTELYGKGGRVCQPAREGKLRCPLIVRPTSEDVITGHLALVLRALNPRWWLPDLLNSALGAQRFRRQVFRGLRIEPWQNHKAYPRELLPWKEGSTQVDLVITWDNPPTTVFIETKYKADLSKSVAGDTGESGYPSDQLIRNIRVGLWRGGWFRDQDMFQTRPADVVVILLSPVRGHKLVEKYRDEDALRSSIPHSDRLVGLPRQPFVGQLGYDDVSETLRRQRRWFGRGERELCDTLVAFLQAKRRQIDPVAVRQMEINGFGDRNGFGGNSLPV
jgi:hypothetical protein